MRDCDRYVWVGIFAHMFVEFSCLLMCTAERLAPISQGDDATVALITSLHKQALHLFSYGPHPLLRAVVVRHGLTASREHVEDYYILASKVRAVVAVPLQQSPHLCYWTAVASVPRVLSPPPP